MELTSRYTHLGLKEGASPKQVFTVGKRVISDLNYQIEVTKKALAEIGSTRPQDGLEATRLMRLILANELKLTLAKDAYVRLLAEHPYYENFLVRWFATILHLVKRR